MNSLTRPAFPPVHAQPRIRLPEGKVAALGGYDLIALGTVRPLTRYRDGVLARRRHDLIARALAANARAAQDVAGMLTRYPPAPRGTESSVAAHLQYVLESGQVILKRQQPQARNWPYLDMPPRAAWNVPCAIEDHLAICAVSDHRLTEAGARFLFILEAGWPNTAERKEAMHPYWPGGASGVTLGAGYDMGRRNAATVTSDLVRAGVSLDLAQDVGNAFGLPAGAQPKLALSQNSRLANTPIMTNGSAWKLMRNIVGSYEHHTAWQLPKEGKDRLFIYEFDALVVDVFQKWNLHTGTLGPLGLGRFDLVTFTPVGGRDAAERQLFRAGQYDSAQLLAS